MFKYFTLLTIFIFVGCTDPIYLNPLPDPPSPELCQTLLDGKVVVVECDTLAPCTSDQECELGYYCLNQNYCVNDCLTDKTCEDRYGDGYVCSIRGRCTGPTHPPVDPPDPVCPAYIGGAIETVLCEDLTECDPANDECAEGTFCLNGDYNYCSSQCFTDEDCPEFVDNNGAALGVYMDCNEQGLCKNPEDLPVCDTNTEVVPANVVFIVDRSGSMDTRFGNTTRYDAVSDALVTASQSLPPEEATFSATLYNREFYSKNDRAECASLTPEPPTTDIETLFDTYSPNGYTPTGEAIAEVLADNTFPPNTVFVLATDGLPNGCDGKEEAEDREYSVSQVAAAAAAGIPTYVVGIDLASSSDHLADLAAAGGTGVGFFNAEDPDGLDDALADIVEHIVTPVLCEPLPDPGLPHLERPDPPVVVE